MRLIELVKAYSNKPWDWFALSTNPCITLQDILDNPDLPFIWQGVSANPNVTIYDISLSYPLDSEIVSRRKFYTEKDFYEHQEINWCKHYLAEYILSVDYILENFDIADCSIMDFLSCNNTLRIHHLINNKHLMWDWMAVSKNNGITFKDVVNNPDLSWYYPNICRFLKISINDIINEKNFPWNFDSLSCNENIKVSDMLDHQEMPWNYISISLYNNTLTEQDIINYPDLEWDFGFMKTNRNISIKFILEYNKTRGYYIGSHEDLTLELIENYYDCWFSMGNVAKYSKITLQDILENTHIIDFNIKNYSLNKHLHVIDVFNNPELDWDWKELSSNTFDL